MEIFAQKLISGLFDYAISVTWQHTIIQIVFCSPWKSIGIFLTTYKCNIWQTLNKYIFCGLISYLLITQPLIVSSQAQSSSKKACRQELTKEIEAIIDRSQFERSRWGIAIRSLQTKEIIYQRESDKFFIPASTVKLLTTAAVLNELGANFRITTPIYATGELPNLDTVIIKGQGDPTISTKTLENIAKQFKALGIRSIERLIIDDSYFPDPAINPTWEWLDTYYYYATSVNSVILNENTATLTLLPEEIGQSVRLQWSDAIASRQWQVNNRGITTASDSKYTVEIDGLLGQPVLNIRGSLPQDNGADEWDLAIANPANYFLETWRYLLFQEGIEVNRGAVTKKSFNTSEGRIIAQMYSPPLKELLVTTNRESNNLYAGVLLRILAKKLAIEDPILALQTSLDKLAIDNTYYSLIDGSGLSRQNLITPNGLIQTLIAMSEHQQAEIYKTSLALAGNNGTMKLRLNDTELANNLWGKTGSLSGIISLAGYLQLDRERSLAFSIVVNNFDDKNKIVREAMDEMLLLLPQFRSCLSE